MNVVVLVCGIADPRKPLARPLTQDGLAAARSAQAVLSPFDEAAIELALKLRDADADVRITALVAGRDAGDPLLRTLASLRADRVCQVSTAALAVWDGKAFATALAAAAQHLCPDAALFLIGREFGDFDDGTVPASLAGRLGCAYAGLATAIDRHGERFRVIQPSRGRLLRTELGTPLLVSVTNDVGNRLRHPLLKNVMAARRATFEAFDPGPAVDDAVTLGAVLAAAPDGTAEPCRWLDGAPHQQAQALAALLLDGVEGA